MYPLLSHWTAEQAMDRPYDPDRLDRIPVEVMFAAAESGRSRSRVSLSASRLRARVGAWIRRGSLGPVPHPSAGGRAGHGW
jgi:hypothetical protein